MNSEDTLHGELQSLKESNEALQKEFDEERAKHLQTIKEMREIRGDLEQVVDAYRQGQAELEDLKVQFLTLQCTHRFTLSHRTNMRKSVRKSSICNRS